jgi:hypothetical protein
MTSSYPVSLAQGLLQDPGPAPLVIGVTGHRDPTPEAVQLVRANTRRQLEQLMQELPHTPLVMLNGMAAGIDTEIAEEFLAVVAAQRRHTPSTTPLPHHQLVATMPKPPQTFEGDFAGDPAALQRHRQLLLQADAVLHPGNGHELRIPPLSEGHTLSSTDPTPYAQQGVFVVRHCYLLFAYYDGIDTGLMGGTAQVVAIQREQIYPLFVNVAEVAASREPAALICHATPRLKNPTPEHALGQIRYWPLPGQQDELLSSDAAIPELLLELPRQLEAINRRVADPGLTPTPEDDGLQTRLHAVLSEDAGRLKRVHIRRVRGVVVFGFVLLVILELLEGLPWYGLALLVLLASLALLPRLQQRSKERFIAKRSLIECLAVQYLWSAVGVEIDTADLFHVRNHTQLRIARLMLRAVKVQLLALYSQQLRPMQPALQQGRLWLEGQVEFFRGKIAAFRRYNANCRRAAWVMGASAAMIGFAQLLPGAPEDLYIAAVALLAASASAYAYGELIGYEETANRYERSLEQFKRGVRALDLLQQGKAESQGADPADPWFRHRIVMEAMGREKIDELNDWIADQIQRIYRPGG